MVLLANIFDLGLRAPFIWSALAVTFVVMILLLAVSLVSARTRMREWERLRETTGRRRSDTDEAEA